MKSRFLFFCGISSILFSCTNNLETGLPLSEGVESLSSVASLLAELPLDESHYEEVYDAVTSSDGNGYDEEYLMKDLFDSPGRGVGEEENTKSEEKYPHPIRDLIREYCAGTKSSIIDIGSLENSDIQIYWPFSSDWDHETSPIITFDPLSDASENIGYETVMAADGTKRTREVKVSEETAKKRPVWVVNCNDDSGFQTVEILRKRDPHWMEGGEVIVTKAEEQKDFKTLVLSKIKMNRNYDSWFGGASEFLVKMGSVEGFTASTEAELKLYSPTVTDFMISIKRKQLGEWVPFDVVMVSKWSSALEELAFLITEDDGGTRTSWKFEAIVKVNSKSYGIDMEIPLNEKDDIVWRGGLSSAYLEKYQGVEQHFGGVDLIFDFI